MFFLKLYICIEIKQISNFEEVSLSLTGTNHYAIYSYSNIKSILSLIIKSESNTYIQIRKKDKTESRVKIYSYNSCAENIIQYDETSGTFSGISKTFNTSLNQEYEEFNLEQEKNSCNILVFYIPKNSEQNYDGSFLIFNTPVTVTLNELSMSKYYFVFNNNYNSNEYIFYLKTDDLDLSQDNVLNCQMRTFSNNNFKFTVSKQKVIILIYEELYEESQVNNLNYNLKLEKQSTYQIKIHYNCDEKSSEERKFALYFEIKASYNKVSSLLNETIICNEFLSNSIFYYYYNINNMELNENKFFILNYLINNFKEIKIEYSISNQNIDFDSDLNDYYLYQLASQSNYSELKNKSEIDKNIIYYKYTKDITSSNSNILFIKITGIFNDLNNFKINQICTKNIQKEILNTNTYKKFFNSTSILNKMG